MYQKVGCIGIIKRGTALHIRQEHGMHGREMFRGYTVQLGQQSYQSCEALDGANVHIETRSWTNDDILPAGPLGHDCQVNNSLIVRRGQRFPRVRPTLMLATSTTSQPPPSAYLGNLKAARHHLLKDSLRVVFQGSSAYLVDILLSIAR